MSLSLITVTANVGLFWVFIDYLEWGFVGAPAALTVAEVLQAFLFLVFTPRSFLPPYPSPHEVPTEQHTRPIHHK